MVALFERKGGGGVSFFFSDNHRVIVYNFFTEYLFTIFFSFEKAVFTGSFFSKGSKKQVSVAFLNTAFQLYRSLASGRLLRLDLRASNCTLLTRRAEDRNTDINRVRIFLGSLVFVPPPFTQSYWSKDKLEVWT